MLCHISEGLSDTWYISTCEGKKDDGPYKMNNLMRVQDGRSSKWKYPFKCDLQNLHLESVLNCKIDGEWNVSNERPITFLLRDHIQIELLVQPLYFNDTGMILYLYGCYV